jgi:hypothetical protein
MTFGYGSGEGGMTAVTAARTARTMPQPLPVFSAKRADKRRKRPERDKRADEVFRGKLSQGAYAL